jgi:hypothetical protein
MRARPLRDRQPKKAVARYRAVTPQAAGKSTGRQARPVKFQLPLLYWNENNDEF